MSDPKLFTELLCILYKPANGEREEPTSEAVRATDRVLQSLPSPTGHARQDGTIVP